MDPTLYLTFIAATALLMLTPGPNMALIVANSVAHGTRHGLLTVAGTGSAMVLQLAVTALGMTAFLGLMADWFEWLRWLGVAYLVYLGVRQWRAPAPDPAATAPRPGKAGTVARGFLVSLTNPKTLLFYAAFFPQFVTPGPGVGAQLLLLTATFLALAVAIDSGWALLAGRVRGVLAPRARLRNRITGGLLVGAGVGLALARR